MAELEKTQEVEVASKPEKEREKFESTTAVIERSNSKLAKFGGFDFFEAVVEGSENLNPERKARKKIFLTEADKKKQRDELKGKLLLWIAVIGESSTIADMVAKCTEKSESSEKLLKKNQKRMLDATRTLEQSYRTVSLFYKNSASDKIKNITIMNASPDQLKDLDNPKFIEFIGEELKQKYDKLDLRENYSLMVIPGYLGSNMVVEKWAKMAYENKVMLVTDFTNFDRPDDVMAEFESAKLSGGDAYRSNVIMTCNWLVGRGKNKDLGEDEDLMVPPSAALAGTIYRTVMSQPTAGKKHGGLSDVENVAFELKKSEIADMEKLGLVPMVNEYGKVMAFSAKTLFNGDNLGLQTYSVVRVFDYVTKVLIDFLNRRAFENWNSVLEKDLKTQISVFLNSITGPGKLIESYNIKRLLQDPLQKDRIYLDVTMMPYFPAKNFMIKMDGTKGIDENSAAWKAQYEKA